MAIFSCQAAGDFTFRKLLVLWIILLKSGFRLSKSFFFFFQWKPFENYEKKIFYFRLKRSFSSYNICFCSYLSGHIRNWLDKKDKVNFKIDDLIYWETDNYNTHTAQHSRNKDIHTMKFGHLMGYNVRYIFIQKS